MNETISLSNQITSAVGDYSTFTDSVTITTWPNYYWWPTCPCGCWEKKEKKGIDGLTIKGSLVKIRELLKLVESDKTIEIIIREIED